MRCSYQECQKEFSKVSGSPGGMGYMIHINDAINDTVLWGAYCNADCLLSDLGPFFLQRAEAEAPKVMEEAVPAENPDQNPSSNMTFNSIIARDLITRIGSDSSLELKESLDPVTMSDGNTVNRYTASLKSTAGPGLTVTHDHHGVLIGYTGLGNISTTYLTNDQLTSAILEDTVTTARDLLVQHLGPIYHTADAVESEVQVAADPF